MPAGDVIDVFDRVQVPEKLADHLRTVELVDHHVHGVFNEPVDRAGFEESINEARPTPPSPRVHDPIRFSAGPFPAALVCATAGPGCLRRCRHLLEATHRTHPPGELADVFLPPARVARWVVDTGFKGDLISTPPQRLTELSGAPCSEILRLERLAEDLLEAGTAAEAFPEAFRAALTAAAANPEIVGTKTIAAYRTGFDIDWSRPSDTQVVEHARALAARPSTRVDSPPVLIAFGVHEAAERQLPIQVHVGFGDRDLDLQRTDPLLLLPLLRTMVPPVPVLLLHCYPFHRQAGYLAQAFDHVNFDVGLGINYLGVRSTALVAEAMETAPFAKQLYSSDAFGPPELHLLGSVLWRRAMGLELGGWIHRGDCSVEDAIRIVDMIGVHNARRVYGL